MWLADYIAICGSMPLLGRLALASDLTIAIAYFAIPAGLATILVKKRHDISRPGMLAGFVAFITACGLTHLVHAVQMPFTTVLHTELEVAVKITTALVSMGTAVMLIYNLPAFLKITSRKHRREELENLVEERTREKQALVFEINHQLGNQLNIMASAVRLEATRINRELRDGKKTEQEVLAAQEVLEHLENVCNDMNKRYHDNEPKFAQLQGFSGAVPGRLPPQMKLSAAE